MWSPYCSCISCIHEISSMKYVMLPSCCRMDEVLQQSNEWRELVIPAASRTWIRRLIEAIVDIWHCKRVKYQLLNVI
jgi:hypothetical protein